MAHIEALADPFDSKDPDVEGEVGIDILGYFFEVEQSLPSIDDVSIIKFKIAGDSIAESVYFFIGSPCP